MLWEGFPVVIVIVKTLGGGLSRNVLTIMVSIVIYLVVLLNNYTIILGDASAKIPLC